MRPVGDEDLEEGQLAKRQRSVHSTSSWYSLILQLSHPAFAPRHARCSSCDSAAAAISRSRPVETVSGRRVSCARALPRRPCCCYFSNAFEDKVFQKIFGLFWFFPRSATIFFLFIYPFSTFWKGVKTSVSNSLQVWLSSCEISWFIYGYRYGALIGLQWSHNVESLTWSIQKREFTGQSQRRILPRTSNHENSPDTRLDSVDLPIAICQVLFSGRGFQFQNPTADGRVPDPVSYVIYTFFF
jgi:ribosomal protein L34E